MPSDEFSGGKEVPSNWFKFTKVGDGIKGTLVSHRTVKATAEGFADQEVYELRRKDGQTWNVGISVRKAGTLQRLNSCKAGEIVAIVFDSEGTSAVKGGAKSKNLKVLTYGMDPDYKHDALDEIPFE